MFKTRFLFVIYSRESSRVFLAASFLAAGLLHSLFYLFILLFCIISCHFVSYHMVFFTYFVLSDQLISEEFTKHLTFFFPVFFGAMGLHSQLRNT